jgi:hypothetical protein
MEAQHFNHPPMSFSPFAYCEKKFSRLEKRAPSHVRFPKLEAQGNAPSLTAHHKGTSVQGSMIDSLLSISWPAQHTPNVHLFSLAS